MNYAVESLKKHAEWKGKIEVIATAPVATKEDLSLAYTPGVAQPCLEIQKDVSKSYELTRRHNMKNSRQIIYHLDSINLSNYSDYEIKYMLLAY